MKVNNILIPVERSDFSLAIIHLVEQFFAPEQNALNFFHVAEEPMYLQEMSEIEFARYLEKLREGLQAEIAIELAPWTNPLRAKGYAVSVHAVFGEPIPEIERFIAHHNIDLLAMMTHGHTGLKRVLFGSVAQQLLQQLTLPILLFHPPAHPQAR